MSTAVGYRLEQYTIKRPQEVLMVTAEVADGLDQIVIFKGFSSSLMHPTVFDPDVPILPAGAKILTIDRLKSPYNPDHPQYLEQGLTWQGMQVLLEQVGV
ncbi:MAG: hypothetical protein F6K19_20000 [Cyanothece sp. SIO1E1]|nr:hypothetical protein [Cyanothece sp. SIO1E1]